MIWKRGIIIVFLLIMLSNYPSNGLYGYYYKWHSCLKKGTVLNWDVAEVKRIDTKALRTGENGSLKQNDRIQVQLLQTLPSFGQWDINTESEYVEYQLNGVKTELPLNGWFAFTILPIEYYLSNNTMLTNEGYLRFSREIISLEIVDNYITTVFRFNEFDEITMINHYKTGIVLEFSHDRPNHYYFKMMFTEKGSSIDIEGNSLKEDNKLVSFLPLSSTILILCGVILARSKSRHIDLVDTD